MQEYPGTKKPVNRPVYLGFRCIRENLDECGIMYLVPAPGVEHSTNTPINTEVKIIWMHLVPLNVPPNRKLPRRRATYFHPAPAISSAWPPYA